MIATNARVLIPFVLLLVLAITLPALAQPQDLAAERGVAEMLSAGPDCNGNGIEDAQDIASGDNPFACGDSEGDGCEDCAGGSFAPGDDGPDADGDLYCDAGDCDPADGSVWGETGPVTSLRLEAAPDVTLVWLPPVEGGGLEVRYDTLRSTVPSDFLDPASCLESDALDTSTVDSELPPASVVFHYLIRAENACPGSEGSLGTDSAGTPRSGLACP